MKFFEVIKKENVGKSYEVFIDEESKGVWELKETYRSKEIEFYKDGETLTGLHFSSQIVRMEFEEVIDWTEIPVDTKVLVSSDGKKWSRRHFAKYEDGKIYCFNSGTTSFTVNEGYCPCEKVLWEYAKLYQE